jgi:hypothetical protein
MVDMALEIPLMTCDGCGQTVPWTPYGSCSWPCYDRPRESEAEEQAMHAAAPDALAFFMQLAPGRRVGDTPE